MPAQTIIKTIASPFYDGPDGEPDWTPSFLAGEHPWQQRLAALAGMFYRYNTDQMQNDVMCLARSMLKHAEVKPRHRVIFRIAQPPARDSQRGMPNSDKESLFLDADRSQGPLCILVTTARHYQHHLGESVRRTRAMQALSDAAQALNLLHEADGTFLGLACVNNKFSRLFCLKSSNTFEFWRACDTAGPLFLLEVPEGSPMAGKVATLDAYCKLDVHANLAHTLVAKNLGPPRRPRDLAVNRTMATAVTANEDLTSLPKLSPGFRSRLQQSQHAQPADVGTLQPLEWGRSRRERLGSHHFARAALVSTPAFLHQRAVEHGVRRGGRSNWDNSSNEVELENVRGEMLRQTPTFVLVDPSTMDSLVESAVQEVLAAAQVQTSTQS
ncbi:hypothetical protein A1Q1_02659 [Trichosporon asahii var. asahii CBS 2479]|uniref:Uncharacterized protein n=1 Tax=Trichosporon asahii var. asahii (strain ATCC 90039 / CBS 2479 / JCM 2466 / KCTC 7840 / NBRC 103889/ NCYC 2677 / UAMH 7654) TaxID=1186058 RepID=J5SZK7_TRIAS|nr:hypothetical protein A1Q1_02659 [Trichosporon asahii var. asahii CBS 2479]EJT48376.1 hypothetical protein A1Q1_02659 [Trichosporon asahii var. asahii CBS 2479]